MLKEYIGMFNLTEGALFIGRNGKRIQKSVIYDNIERIKKSAGLSNSFTIHGFRRYFIDRLRREGIDTFTIQRLARHKDISVTSGYTNVDNEELMNALSKVSLN